MRRTPDFNQFLKVLKRAGRPDHLPFYEHIVTKDFIARRTGTDYVNMYSGHPGYWRTYVDFWMGMGFDCVPLEAPPNINYPEPKIRTPYQSEQGARIFNMEDFEKFPWPDVSAPMSFHSFEAIAKILPDGAKIVGGVSGGPFETATQSLMGLMGLSYALIDQPGLVRAVFDKLGELYVSAVRQLAAMDAIGACRQGDDLGFKSSTFLPPAALREYVFPIYRDMAAASHAQGKPFILHSCGNLDEVYEDLIEYCGIDAKHSFEDIILPVEEFKRRYGERITPIGGLDVDLICRGSEEQIRAYTRGKIEQCFGDGYWALGTGNSLTDYMPVENYLIVLDEAIRVS